MAINLSIADILFFLFIFIFIYFILFIYFFFWEYDNVIEFIQTNRLENYFKKYSRRFIKIREFVSEFPETSCQILTLFPYFNVAASDISEI